MADEADRAQRLEEREREALLAGRLVRPAERPLIVHGRRLCMGCGEALQARRLKAAPEAVRCVDCQNEKELENRRAPRL